MVEGCWKGEGYDWDLIPEVRCLKSLACSSGLAGHVRILDDNRDAVFRVLQRTTILS
jgi:hypothetical protein